MFTRTLGLEKTIQVKQYEPIKVSAYVSEVPLFLWKSRQFVESLYHLLVIQLNKVLVVDARVRKELSGLDLDSGMDYLNEMEKALLNNLDLENIEISIDVTNNQE